jgi:4-amino-4-deoxy-L-arabinose transferase-like glycosyltransferase
MRPLDGSLGLLSAAWLMLVLAALSGHPLWPIDETRYAGVAWEMWLRQDFLVPYMNGKPYSDKPPLLFWLLHAGWWLFGVNEWWPRVGPALFALGSLLLTRRIAGRLWPEYPPLRWLAPAVLMSCLLWAIFTSALMFDLVLSFWVLLAVSGVLDIARGSRRGVWWMGVGLGLGILTKGPVALLHVLPVAVLAPWWSPAATPSWWRWYRAVLLAVLLAAGIALLWAVPAAWQGGADYARAIFWDQTSGRLAHALEHRNPWWWYLPLLPLLFFPWAWWPPAWSALARLPGDWRTRFCVSWVLPVFAGFSLISGKQEHYLLPLFPACALLLGWGLSRSSATPKGISQWPVAVFFLLVADVLIAGPHWQERLGWPAWTAAMPLSGAFALVGLGGLLVLPWRPRPMLERAVGIAAAGVIGVGLCHVLILQRIDAYDLRAVSRFLGERQAAGEPLAHLGRYHEQFHFYGRLRHPVAVIDPDKADRWAKIHPNGWIVTYYRGSIPDTGQPPAFQQAFRARWLVVWPAAALASQRHGSRPTAP